MIPRPTISYEVHPPRDLPMGHVTWSVNKVQCSLSGRRNLKALVTHGHEMRTAWANAYEGADNPEWLNEILADARHRLGYQNLAAQEREALRGKHSHLDMVKDLLRHHCPDRAEYILGFVRVYGQAERGHGWREGVDTALEHSTRNDDGITLSLDRKNPYIYEPKTREV